MAGIPGAGEGGLGGAVAGPGPHRLAPGVAQRGQDLGAGVGIVLALEGHRGGIGPDAGALAGSGGGNLAGNSGSDLLHMAGVTAAGEGGLGGLVAGPGPGGLAIVVAQHADGQGLQGGLVLAFGVAEQLAADGAHPVGLDAGLLAGGGDLRHGGEGMTVGAGIGGAVGHGHVVDGEHGVGIVIALVGLLIEVEGELGIVRAEGGGNGNVGRAHEPITAYRLQIGCGPDGGPGLAAVGGGLHGHGAVVADDGLEQQVIEAQRRRLAGEVHHRGDEILILQLVAAACHRQQGLADAAHAPAAPGIFIVIHVDAGLLGGVEVSVGALVPGIGAVAAGGLEGPAVEGEAVAGHILEVVLEHHHGDVGNLLEGGGHGIALVHGQGQDIAGNGGGAAVDLHGGQLIALVRGEGNVHGLAGDIGSLTGGGHGTAVGGGGGQGHGVAGSAAGNGELDVVHGQRTGFVSGIHIMEGELNAVHCILGRDSQLLASGNNAGLLAIVAVEEVPQSGPGLAAVSGYLHGGCVGLVLCSVVAVAIVEGQGCFLAGQIHRRGDQILVLRAAVPVIGDIGVLGVVDILPVPVGLLLPGVAVGVDTLQAPAVEGEALTGHRFKVVVEQHHVAGRLGLLEGGGDGVVHAHPLEGVVADGAEIRAVHVDVDDLIALGGGDVEGLAGTLLHQSLTGGGDGSALTGGGGDGHIVVPLLGVQLNVVHRQGGAALTGVDKGEAQVLAVLQALGDGHLGLGLGPGGEQAGIPLQVPDLLPVLAAVAGGHDLQVAVLILHGVPIGGVEIEDHVDLGIHAADIGGAGDQPLVLLVVVVMIHGGHVVLVAVPGVQRAALALDAPVVGEPLLVEVLGPEDVGGGDGAVIVGVAGSADGIHLGVAGVVVDDHAEGLAEAGDIILLDVAGDAGLVLAEALHTIEHLAVLDVVEHHGRHILVIGHVQAQIVPALGLGDLQVVGMGLLGVDGDGEGPGVLLVGPHAVAIGQGGLDGHGGLGVVGQLGVVGVGAVPGLDAVIFGVHTGGHNAVIVVAVDGLAHILAVLAVVHLAVGAGDGILQALGVA